MKLARIVRLLSITVPAAIAQDWSAQRAASYLDSRQKEWFAWPTAKAQGGPCLSCHTGLTYLLARPVLRQMLAEGGPTPYESGLLDGLRARVDRMQPRSDQPTAMQGLGSEAVLSALLLMLAEDGHGLSAPTKQAFDRLWALQIREGPQRGSWSWFDLNLDPWETPDSAYFGASLAALAAGSTPDSYRTSAEVAPRLTALADYLRRERDRQPLHNRIALVWAATKLPAALPGSPQSIIDEALAKQQPDGG
jgi:squalene-hopene/tetraprenyl-beta-curcumene cyclase